MSVIYKILSFLQGEMEKPKMYGLFHLICLSIMIIFIIYSFANKEYTEKRLKKYLAVYGIGAFVLELLKQIIWSVEFDSNLNIAVWDYSWYIAPFQLCSTPIYVSIICLFLKKGKLKDSLLSYMAYVTILGSLATALYPQSVFVKTTLVNIHTMYLHLGSLALSIYLLISKEVKTDYKSFFNSYKVFLVFAAIAEMLNIIIHNSGILNGKTFNMFYISPYFISELPILDVIQKNVPFIIFLFIYLIAIFIGSYLIFIIAKTLNKKAFVK